jgi:hypothetical protein
MIGKSSVVWFGLACIASAILYHTSYRVQAESERLASINRQIVAEQDAIQVLRAEWAYLNDPARIERLMAQHTKLQPIKAAQIVGFDALPEKQPAAPLVAAAPAPAPGHKPAAVAGAAQLPHPMQVAQLNTPKLTARR